MPTICRNVSRISRAKVADERIVGAAPAEPGLPPATAVPLVPAAVVPATEGEKSFVAASEPSGGEGLPGTIFYPGVVIGGGTAGTTVVLPIGPVPEPETWAMMLAGLAPAGAWRYRRDPTRRLPIRGHVECRRGSTQQEKKRMLEKLPDAFGHALRGQRAGLDKIAFQTIDLRAGMAAITVKSVAFADHAPIPAPYTADGVGMSPPLQWSGVPAQATSLVLIVEDADAPTPQPLVHAIVVDLPAGDGALSEGALPSRDHDGTAVAVGRNLYLQAAWLPPDPPPGHGVHRYAFQLFALESGPPFDSTPGRDAVLEAVRERGLASGCLFGTYERPDTSISEPASEAAPVLSPPPLAA